MNLLSAHTPCKLILLVALSAPLYLAAQAPARFHSTEIHADHAVTFSYKDASATKVTLALDGVAFPGGMTLASALLARDDSPRAQELADAWNALQRILDVDVDVVGDEGRRERLVRRDESNGENEVWI